MHITIHRGTCIVRPNVYVSSPQCYSSTARGTELDLTIYSEAIKVCQMTLDIQPCPRSVGTDLSMHQIHFQKRCVIEEVHFQL